MGRHTFYELTRRSIPLTKNDGMFLSWRDSVINVRTDKALHFFEFTYNLECLEKDIDLLEISIPCPRESPAEALCKSKFINSEMKNYDYTEMILDSSFWPHNKPLAQEMTNVSMSAWSPPYFIENKSLFAVLNNVGGVEIFMQQQHSWASILSLSSYILDSLEYNKAPKNFEELKTAVYIVASSSICWAPTLNSDQSCYFVTAQKNGMILIWKIFKSEAVLKGKIQSNMSEIKHMLWIPRSEIRVWLICADVVGKISNFEIEIASDDINLLQSYVLWEHKDRMIASYLNHIIIDDNIVFFFSKHRHFVVQILDENCNISSQFTDNVNDYKITDITNSLDGYYLATINMKIYKLHISVSGDTIAVDLLPVQLKESYPTYELYGLCFSNTNTLCALGMIDRRLLCRKEVLKIDIVIVSTESKLEAIMPTFMNNPTEKLTDYWDCIEALRYKINKTKRMPGKVDFKSLFAEASNNIYKLKIYLILLIFFTNMRKLARMCSDVSLPELSLEKVKEKILLLHAQSTIEMLFKKYKEDGILSSSENESFCGCIKYLEYYSKKHKTDIVMDNETLGVMTTNVKYQCQSCDDVVEGFTCKSGHLNMYCMLSLTPITGDEYLVCKCCGFTARTDITVNPLCVFCDQCLIKID